MHEDQVGLDSPLAAAGSDGMRGGYGGVGGHPGDRSGCAWVPWGGFRSRSNTVGCPAWAPPRGIASPCRRQQSGSGFWLLDSPGRHPVQQLLLHPRVAGDGLDSAVCPAGGRRLGAHRVEGAGNGLGLRGRVCVAGGVVCPESAGRILRRPRYQPGTPTALPAPVWARASGDSSGQHRDAVAGCGSCR